MYKVDQKMTNAVAATLKLGGDWRSGKRSIISVSKTAFNVNYFDDGKHPDGSLFPQDNTVFHYDTKTKDFWISNCGWNSRTTKNLLNDCFRGVKLPYEVFVSKDRFCIRDLETKLERIIGDGRISKSEILDKTYWCKKVK